MGTLKSYLFYSTGFTVERGQGPLPDCNFSGLWFYWQLVSQLKLKDSFHARPKTHRRNSVEIPSFFDAYLTLLKLVQ